jgi:hypothetical protein
MYRLLCFSLRFQIQNSQINHRGASRNRMEHSQKKSNQTHTNTQIFIDMRERERIFLLVLLVLLYRFPVFHHLIGWLVTRFSERCRILSQQNEMDYDVFRLRRLPPPLDDSVGKQGQYSNR